jgi:hypothetical protein
MSSATRALVAVRLRARHVFQAEDTNEAAKENAKNEAAKEKVNEIKHAVQVMFVVVCAIMITFSFYLISDTI